jgi:hypothetical protein
MKEQLKTLYQKNRRDFDVWNYLWLFADNNSINFTHSDLAARFGLPASSLHRILNIYPEQWNEEKVFVEYEKIAYKQYNVKFYPKGKKATKTELHSVYDELFVWLKQYYADLEYDYADLTKHKRYVKIICDKLTKAMKKRGTEITDDLLRDTFKFLFINIDDWWKESGNITLTMVSKHFTKILNQVKTNNGGTKKRDSYTKAAEKVDEVDFSRLTRKP